MRLSGYVVGELTVTLNRISPVPLYHQLSRQLVEAIESGRLPKGSFLDSEIELAERWQVSRPTVRRAIQDLVDSGMLVRRRGVGTQVVSDQVRRPFKLTSLFEDLAATGREPLTTVIAHDRVAADRQVAEALGIPVGTEVVHIERLRSVGTQPLAILRNWLIVDAAGVDQLRRPSRHGLYALLRRARCTTALGGATPGRGRGLVGRRRPARTAGGFTLDDDAAGDARRHRSDRRARRPPLRRDPVHRRARRRRDAVSAATAALWGPGGRAPKRSGGGELGGVGEQLGCEPERQTAALWVPRWASAKAQRRRRSSEV